MALARMVAQQLGRPAGLVGSLAAHIWNRRNAALNDVPLRSLSLNPDDRVLEIGFGGGYLLGQIASVVRQGLLAGVDISPKMVGFCERRYRSLVQEGRLELKCASAEALPYPPAGFTKLCTVNSIFYWQSVPAAFAECSRVLAAGGTAVICFTLRTSLEHRSFAQHIGLHEPQEVQQALATAGFGDVQAVRASDRHRDFMCLTARKRC
ncbi:MAG: class I SAM-dependent methyltransferase [Chloroflexi bacterium]|nr:class I SAM-dependent methyltransferase [Chloroflexota bacterium]